MAVRLGTMAPVCRGEVPVSVVERGEYHAFADAADAGLALQMPAAGLHPDQVAFADT